MGSVVTWLRQLRQGQEFFGKIAERNRRNRASFHPQRPWPAYIRGNRPRRHSVDSDPGSEFEGELAHEPNHRMLRGGVEGPAASNIKSCVRDSKNDISARLQKFRHGRFRSQQIAFYVDREQLVERLTYFILRQPHQRQREIPYTGIADKAVELAKSGDTIR